MNELKVTGKQKFMGSEIPVILGGFGDAKKCISDKTVADIHGKPVYEIRKSLGRNIQRFAENVDFIDLKQRSNEVTTLELLLNLGYAKQSITQAEHIYILSERGYAKLIKIMDTDLAWKIHDSLIDEYFALREEKQQMKIEVDKPKEEKPSEGITVADRIRAMELIAFCPKYAIGYVASIAKPFMDGEAGTDERPPVGALQQMSKKRTDTSGYAVPFNKERLARHLNKTGWNSRNLAHASGMDISMINRYLSGRHSPSQNSRIRICQALGKPNDWLNG